MFLDFSAGRAITSHSEGDWELERLAGHQVIRIASELNASSVNSRYVGVTRR
jgi:hypothetical protein